MTMKRLLAIDMNQIAPFMTPWNNGAADMTYVGISTTSMEQWAIMVNTGGKLQTSDVIKFAQPSYPYDNVIEIVFTTSWYWNGLGNFDYVTWAAFEGNTGTILDAQVNRNNFWPLFQPRLYLDGPYIQSRAGNFYRKTFPDGQWLQICQFPCDATPVNAYHVTDFAPVPTLSAWEEFYVADDVGLIVANIQNNTGPAIYDIATKAKIADITGLTAGVTLFATAYADYIYAVLRNAQIAIIDLRLAKVVGLLHQPHDTNTYIGRVICYDQVYNRLLIVDADTQRIDVYWPESLPIYLTHPIPTRVPLIGKPCPVVCQAIGSIGEYLPYYPLTMAESGGHATVSIPAYSTDTLGTGTVTLAPATAGSETINASLSVDYGI